MMQSISMSFTVEIFPIGTSLALPDSAIQLRRMSKKWRASFTHALKVSGDQEAKGRAGRLGQLALFRYDAVC